MTFKNLKTGLYNGSGRIYTGGKEVDVSGAITGEQGVVLFPMFVLSHKALFRELRLLLVAPVRLDPQPRWRIHPDEIQHPLLVLKEKETKEKIFDQLFCVGGVPWLCDQC